MLNAGRCSMEAVGGIQGQPKSLVESVVSDSLWIRVSPDLTMIPRLTSLLTSRDITGWLGGLLIFSLWMNLPSVSSFNAPHLLGEIQDDLLRMLSVCCDDAIPTESQLVLALKTLCGFRVEEIALRLFTSEANVYKRLSRARSRLRALGLSTGDLTDEQMTSRLSVVNRVLYALFSEGYLSSGAEFAIRRDLCEEAIRLATILADHHVGKSPEVFALLALMHLHTARMTARQDGSGGLLLLEEQDRALWDSYQIERGLTWLAMSAQGDQLSRYHAEAGVAAEHCLAPTFEATRWDRVVDCYSQL